jgi:hypothetical protein
MVRPSTSESSNLLVRLLLAANADANMKNSDGCTALDLSSNPAIRRVLTDHMTSKVGGISKELPVSTCGRSPAPLKLGGTLNAPVQSYSGVPMNKIDLLCYRGPNAWRTNTNAEAATSFGGRQVLDIKISEPADLLSKNARIELTREVLFSIALWRRMCTNCVLGNAAVIRIGDNTYVDERLLGAVEGFDFDSSNLGGKSLQDPSVPPNVNTLSGIYVNARLNQLSPLAEYRVVLEKDSSIQRLCSAAPEKVPIEFQGIREAFQCGNSLKNASASLQIKVLDGPTKCGVSKAIVGCESSDLNVELNAQEYSFVDHKTHRLIFGKGTEKADLQVLLLHETGHWAGIYDHLNSSRNIMSPYLDECVCINQAVIDKLGRSTKAISSDKSHSLLNTKLVK